MPTPPLHRLFYLSRAHIDPCGLEPGRILEVAARRNQRLAVTGLLCFSGDHFGQILEGDEAPLLELMRSIAADPRHTLLRTWPPMPAGPDRWFPGWAMAYTFDERLEAMVERLVGDGAPAEIPIDLLAAGIFDRLALYRGPRSEG